MPPCSCQNKYKYKLTTSAGNILTYDTPEEARAAQRAYGGAIQKRMA